MKYTARNLFILVLTGYTLTALPLNPELLTLDLSRFSYENAIRNQASQGAITYAYVLKSAQRPLVNPQNVEFLIRAEGGKKPKWTDAPMLTLEVLSTEGAVLKTLSGQEFSSFELPAQGFNPYELSYTLQFDRDRLGVSGTSFTLRLSSSDSALDAVPPLEIPVQYLDKLVYKPAAASVPPGKQMIITYYADATGHFSVPVSQEAPLSGKLFRSSVNQLLTPPPAAMGLKDTPIVPRVSSIQYSNGLVSCVLGGPVLPELYTDPVLAATAEKTLRNSIAAISSPYRISKLRYGWSGIQPIPGWPAEAFAVQPSTRVWLSLIIPERHTLLVPADSTEITPQGLFEVLKSGTEGLMATVPGQAILESANMEGDVLVLGFGAGFQALFSEAPDQAALTLDSLTHTMTGLPGVRALRLEESAVRITTLGGIPLPEALVPSPYVNPASSY